MSRRLDYTRALVAPATLVTVVTAPGGEKLEVVNLSVTSDGVNAYSWLIFGVLGGVATGLDEIVVPAGQYFKAVSYQSLALYAGDALQVIIITAGTANGTVVANYVTVNPG